MKLCVAVAFIAALIGLTSAQIVSMVEGNVEGTVMMSRLGRTFHAFLRIPFAKPPIGDLRFESPQPIEPWTGTLNGTAYGPQCVQPGARLDLGMSEDCLQLNVFTTNLIGNSPVIFFIHGGSFEFGTGIDQGGPHNLMDREVVVVSINYRLGAFGFMATGTRESPGNVGLKDQVMALQWVQRNIRSFGGNPDMVTISGLSAGSVAVTAHILSPMSRGLFHRAIAISGTITSFSDVPKDYLNVAKKLGVKLNCATENTADLVACLKTKPAVDIISHDLREYPECEIVTWLPVVEPDFGQERFLPDDPVKIIEARNFTLVPIMIGRTTDEFVSPVPSVLDSEPLRNLNDNFHVMAPYCFFYEHDGTAKSREISDTLRSSFLPFDTIDVRSFNGLNNLFGDGLIGYSVHRFVHLMSNVTDVYYYKFSYVGRFSIFHYPNLGRPFGVHHADDLQYPFYLDWFGTPPIQANDPENFMVERMTRIYEHFASTGNPIYDPNALNWPKHDTTNEYYMDIGTHMVEKHGLYLERYIVWDRLLTSTPETSETTPGGARAVVSFKILTIIVLVVLQVFSPTFQYAMFDYFSCALIG